MSHPHSVRANEHLYTVTKTSQAPYLYRFLHITEVNASFRVFNDADFVDLVPLLMGFEMESGMKVIERGSLSTFALIILKGQVSIVSPDPTRPKVNLGAGAIVGGEEYFAGGGFRDCDIFTEDPSILASITYENLDDLGDINVNLNAKLMGLLAKSSIDNVKKVSQATDDESSVHQERLALYQKILTTFIADGVITTTELEELYRFRDVYHVTSDEHESALSQLGITDQKLRDMLETANEVDFKMYVKFLRAALLEDGAGAEGQEGKSKTMTSTAVAETTTDGSSDEGGSGDGDSSDQGESEGTANLLSVGSIGSTGSKPKISAADMQRDINDFKVVYGVSEHDHKKALQELNLTAESFRAAIENMDRSSNNASKKKKRRMSVIERQKKDKKTHLLWYERMLIAYISDSNISPGEQRQLDKMRKQYDITDAEHAEALQVSGCDTEAYQRMVTEGIAKHEIFARNHRTSTNAVRALNIRRSKRERLYRGNVRCEKNGPTMEQKLEDQKMRAFKARHAKRNVSARLTASLHREEKLEKMVKKARKELEDAKKLEAKLRAEVKTKEDMIDFHKNDLDRVTEKYKEVDFSYKLHMANQASTEQETKALVAQLQRQLELKQEEYVSFQADVDNQTSAARDLERRIEEKEKLIREEKRDMEASRSKYEKKRVEVEWLLRKEKQETEEHIAQVQLHQESVSQLEKHVVYLENKLLSQDNKYRHAQLRIGLLEDQERVTNQYRNREQKVRKRLHERMASQGTHCTCGAF